jgi:hypothetical protein
MNEIPHQLIDACAEHLRTLHERGQPENFVHALHQLFRDFERWKFEYANSRPNSTILEAIIDQKRLCDKYNAESARLTVAAPGVLDKGDSDE